MSTTQNQFNRSLVKVAVAMWAIITVPMVAVDVWSAKDRIRLNDFKAETLRVREKNLPRLDVLERHSAELSMAIRTLSSRIERMDKGGAEMSTRIERLERDKGAGR